MPFAYSGIKYVGGRYIVPGKTVFYVLIILFS